MDTAIANLIKLISGSNTPVYQAPEIPLIKGRTVRQILLDFCNTLVNHHETFEKIFDQHEILLTKVSEPLSKADKTQAEALLVLVKDLHAKLTQLVLDFANAELEIEEHMGKYMIYYQNSLLERIYEGRKELVREVSRARLETWGLQQEVEEEYGFPKSD